MLDSTTMPTRTRAGIRPFAHFRVRSTTYTVPISSHTQEPATSSTVNRSSRCRRKLAEETFRSHSRRLHVGNGREAMELGAHAVGVGLVDLIEDGLGLLPCGTGIVAVTGGVPGVAEMVQDRGLPEAVVELA